MLLAGNLRSDLAKLAESSGTTSVLEALFTELEAFEGVVWITQNRLRGGMAYAVEWQKRDANGNLVTVRTEPLDVGTWEACAAASSRQD